LAGFSFPVWRLARSGLPLLAFVGCSAATPTVPLVVQSHAPVKATATQLRQGVLQAVKNWGDAKTRIEDVHSRRIAEMLSIEADIAFLEAVSKIDPAAADAPAPDPGRLAQLLKVRPGTTSFEEEVEKALTLARPPRSPAEYFEFIKDSKDGFTDAQRGRLTQLLVDLGKLTGQSFATEEDVAKWLRNQKYGDWSDVVTLFTRRDANGRLAADGAMVVEAIRTAAAELKLEPPDLPELRFVTLRAIARLRHRREQFPAVDRLLSHLLTIAQDLETFLMNDFEAIHWAEAGQAIGKAETLSSELGGRATTPADGSR
jgi:hypothetical protein